MLREKIHNAHSMITQRHLSKSKNCSHIQNPSFSKCRPKATVEVMKIKELIIRNQVKVKNNTNHPSSMLQAFSLLGLLEALCSLG